MNKETLADSFISLYQLIVRLRAPDGCPWDAQQTSDTIKIYLLEEAYEVIDAIEKGSPEEICNELGDLLFQIIFLAYLAEERNEFDLIEVLIRIQSKMIRRHPHVFGEIKVQDAEEVAQNWAKIKKHEKGHPESSTQMGIPKNLPALLMAHQILKRYQHPDDSMKFENILTVLEKQVRDLRQILISKDQSGEKIGEILFSLIELAHSGGLNTEDLLRSVNQKNIIRIQGMGEPVNPAEI